MNPSFNIIFHRIRLHKLEFKKTKNLLICDCKTCNKTLAFLPTMKKILRKYRS